MANLLKKIFKKEDRGCIFLLFIAIIFVFWNLPQTFFQQDEWSAFSHFIYRQSVGFGDALKEFLLAPGAPGLIHFTPLAGLFFQWQYYLWGLNFSSYAYFSLLVHFFNSLLLFYLAKFFFQRKSLALISALLFSLNSISHQGVTWISATTATQGSCFFSILGLIFLINFIKHEKDKFFWLSLLMFFIALLFKETAIFLFLFIPLYLLLFYKNKKKIFSKKIAFPFLGLAVFYSISRLVLFYLSNINNVQKIAGSGFAAWYIHAYRLITLPLKAIVQSLIPIRLILGLSRFLIFVGYPYFEKQKETTAYDFASQTVFADFVSLILLILLIILFRLVFRFLKKLREEQLIQGLIFSLIFISTSSLIFAFIPGQAGYFTFFDSRNLYLTNIGSSLLLTIIIFAVANWLAERIKKRESVFALMAVFLLPIFWLHINYIGRDMRILFKRSRARKLILFQIKNTYPRLAKKAIFYTESNKPYYGLAEKILPFQSGFGQTLLVWYHQKQRFPSEFFDISERRFLWDILDEDYEEYQGRGFGYFQDYGKLVKILKENNLSAENVYAFSWDGYKEELVDITDNIRQKLRNDLGPI